MLFKFRPVIGYVTKFFRITSLVHCFYYSDVYLKTSNFMWFIKKLKKKVYLLVVHQLLKAFPREREGGTILTGLRKNADFLTNRLLDYTAYMIGRGMRPLGVRIVFFLNQIE